VPRSSSQIHGGSRPRAQRPWPGATGGLPTSFGCGAARAARAAALVSAAWLAICLAASTALAAPFDPAGQDWEGLAQLVRLAEGEVGTARVVVAPKLALAELRREDGVLLVHPSRPLDVDELSAFMRVGGRLALFDDYGTGDDLLLRFGIRRVALPTRPAQALRGNAALAVAEPASAHPTVRDAAHVVTNHAVGLEHASLSPLLVVKGDGEPDVLLALAGAVGHGRLIAVGDASVLINAMLRYPGNRALARAVVRYLLDDDVWGKRGGKLYVVVNDFSTTGAFGDPSRAASAIVEGRRAVVEGVKTLRREGAPPGVAYAGALVAALGIVGWTSARVGRTHKPSSPRFTRAVPAVLQGGIAGHAAVLGSPEASRALAVLELKSALEEQLTARLGLERTPPHDELVAQVRAAGLLDEDRTRALALLLRELGKVEALFGRSPHAAGRLEGIHDDRVLAVAARVRRLLDAMSTAGARGTVGRAP